MNWHRIIFFFLAPLHFSTHWQYGHTIIFPRFCSRCTSRNVSIWSQKSSTALLSYELQIFVIIMSDLPSSLSFLLCVYQCVFWIVITFPSFLLPLKYITLPEVFPHCSPYCDIFLWMSIHICQNQYLAEEKQKCSQLFIWRSGLWPY